MLPAFVGTPEPNRIYNTRVEDLLRAMPDKSVDIVVTSPPYNLGGMKRINGGMFHTASIHKKFDDGYLTHDDNMHEEQYQAWIRNIVKECLRISKGLVWVNHKIRFRDSVGIHPLSFMPFPLYTEVVWNKQATMMFNSKRYAISHEYIFGFGKPHYWDDSLNSRMSVWNVQIVTDDVHPCPYPEKLIKPLILSSCPPDGIVFDPFVGSGTTAITAKKLGRRYLGCDMSLTYCELARDRIRQAANDVSDLPMFAETA